jgi:hypothetical protein
VDIARWHDLFVASAGAAAALAGLLIVAMSVNVREIISMPSMSSRAGVAIASLVLIVVVSTCALIPEQPLVILGLEVIVVAAATLAIAVDSAVRIVRVGTVNSQASALAKGTIAAAPALLFLVGGVLLCAELPAGLFWVAAGIATAFIVSVLNAWVLLVEILR